MAAKQPSGLARIVHEETSDTRARVGVRVISKEKAYEFAAEFASDVSHTVKSCALAVGIRPGTVREAISRYENDKCQTLLDEEICEILVKAKEEHIKQIRAGGYIWAGKENRAGTSWMQWQLEVQDPKEHPRKTQVELGGVDGKPIETNSNVQYVITVPPDEPDEPDAEVSAEGE